MAAGLFLDAFVGIDEEEGCFGVGGAGDHVLEEFFVSRSIDDDVLALFGLEPNLRGVDGDVLIAFGLERVHQIGPFEGDTAAFRDALELFEFAFGQRTGVVKKAADESGFAVVDVADDDDLKLFGWG